MSCQPKYAPLPCSKTGVGYTSKAHDIGSKVLSLRLKHSQGFPSLGRGEYFYANILDACDHICEQVKVINVGNDSITIETGLTTCFSSNSKITYTLPVQAIADIAQQVGLNVVSPLIWDCDTQTLSIDCAKLKQMIAECGVVNA